MRQLRGALRIQSELLQLSVDFVLRAFDELVARGFSVEERAIAAQGMLAAHSRQKVAREFAETLLGIFGQGR